MVKLLLIVIIVPIRFGMFPCGADSNSNVVAKDIII